MYYVKKDNQATKIKTKTEINLCFTSVNYYSLILVFICLFVYLLLVCNKEINE